MPEELDIDRIIFGLQASTNDIHSADALRKPQSHILRDNQYFQSMRKTRVHNMIQSTLINFASPREIYDVQRGEEG